jgi:hypothetical protein
MFNGRPHRPRDHLLGGRPYLSAGRDLSKRRIIIEEIEMVYENKIETVPSELKALKAVYEPTGALKYQQAYV